MKDKLMENKVRELIESMCLEVVGENGKGIYYLGDLQEAILSLLTSEVEKERERWKSKIRKRDAKVNATPKRKSYIRHRYHERIGKHFTDCSLCLALSVLRKSK